MAEKLLIAYATNYGSTREVAEAVATALREAGIDADVQPARKVRSLQGYGAVVLGAPLFMFKWHKDARAFLSRHAAALGQRPLAVFALGPMTPGAEKEFVDARDQLDKALAEYPTLKPAAVQIFGGKFDPATLRFPMKLFVGKIPAADLRDWDAIRAWSVSLPALLGIATG